MSLLERLVRGRRRAGAVLAAHEPPSQAAPERRPRGTPLACERRRVRAMIKPNGSSDLDAQGNRESVCVGMHA